MRSRSSFVFRLRYKYKECVGKFIRAIKICIFFLIVINGELILFSAFDVSQVKYLGARVYGTRSAKFVLNVGATERGFEKFSRVVLRHGRL